MINKSRTIECRHVEKPGSDKAKELGCSCKNTGKKVFGYTLTIVNDLCVMHGKAWEKAPSKSLH